MQARLIRVKVDAGRMDELVERYQAAMTEASAEEREAHEATYLLVDRETNEAVVVALWRDLAALDKAANSAWNQALSNDLRPLFISPPERKVYAVEVAARAGSADRTETTREGE